MATFKKHRGKWQAQICVGKNRKAKSFYTKSESKIWALEQELEGNNAKVPITESRLIDAIDRYSLEVSPTKKGARWELIKLNIFKNYQISNILLSELTHKDFAKWRDDRLKQVAPSTVNRELNIWSSICQWCVREWDWLNDNPVRKINRPQNPRHRDRRITEDEISSILLCLGYDENNEIKTRQQEVAVIFLIALETAMRRGEICDLTNDNIHLDKSYLTLVDTKNGDKRDVPLSARAVELFKKANKNEKVFNVDKEVLTALFRRAVKNANIVDLKFHDSRHEAITRLSRKLDVLALAKMIGHRDPKSLMIYYNESAEDIAKRLG